MAARSVCVFCGARPGHDPIYMQEANAVGQMLAAEGCRFDGGHGARGSGRRR